MVKIIDEIGLKSLIGNYDLFFIDLWGVIHNGISLHENAIDVLNKLSELKKEYILLTNAPRPIIDVKNFVEKMGMSKTHSSKIFTSGEASLEFLFKNLIDKKFFHIGPPRDFTLFKEFKKKKIEDINEAEYLLCTGLFDDQSDDIAYYKKIFDGQKSKVLVCTNPDLIVDRGDKRELCAGSVAQVFEEIGGKVEYFGKPYSNVYNLAANIKNKKVLCIGDNLKTDIKGANLLNFDALLISNGVHKEEIKISKVEEVEKKYKVKIDFIQTYLKW
tara:strand:+ start:1314 stop:2132 length:819 start_codon:yes stop_codon:yes gene_type:complete